MYLSKFYQKNKNKKWNKNIGVAWDTLNQTDEN